MRKVQNNKLRRKQKPTILFDKSLVTFRENSVVLKVHEKSSQPQIKSAVEQEFDVRVKAVKFQRTRARRPYRGDGMGIPGIMRNNLKHAIVTLEKTEELHSIAAKLANKKTIEVGSDVLPVSGIQKSALPAKLEEKDDTSECVKTSDKQKNDDYEKVAECVTVEWLALGNEAKRRSHSLDATLNYVQEICDEITKVN